MLFKNLNPIINSELLSKANFNFDGYYYVNNLCPIRLNKVDLGYSVSFIDPTAPSLNITINNYCELISLMMQSLQSIIDKKLIGKTFSNNNETLDFIGKLVKDYFKFDKNLSLVVINSPMGLQVRPNNEYTYTILSGDIRKFKVNYKWSSGDIVNNEFIELEISAQCISWPFLMKLLSSELSEFNKQTDTLIINSVYLLDENKEIPFFGMGIPTIHK